MYRKRVFVRPIGFQNVSEMPSAKLHVDRHFRNSNGLDSPEMCVSTIRHTVLI